MTRRDDRIARTVSFRLLQAVNRMTRPFHEEFGARFGLGLSEWRAVMALAATPGASGRDVADAMGLDPMTASRALRRLEREGRAERRTDPGNRRRHRWTLTEGGWAVFDAVMPTALERDAALFGHVSEADRAALDRVLAALDGGHGIRPEDDAGASPPPREDG